LETRYEERRVRLDDGTVRTEQLFGGGSTAVTTADSKGRILEEVRDSTPDIIARHTDSTNRAGKLKRPNGREMARILIAGLMSM